MQLSALILLYSDPPMARMKVKDHDIHRRHHLTIPVKRNLETFLSLKCSKMPRKMSMQMLTWNESATGFSAGLELHAVSSPKRRKLLEEGVI